MSSGIKSRKKSIDDETNAKNKEHLENSISHLDKFEELFQTVPVAICEIDFEGPCFVNVNDATCSFSGYSRDELLCMNPFALLTPPSAERFKARIRASLASEEINENVEYQGIMKGGRVIDFVLNVKPIWRNGRFRGALVAGYDITERKKAEEERRNLETLLSAVTNASSDAIYVKDRYSRWLFANPALERIAGKSSSGLLGKTDAEIYSNTEVGRIILEHDRRVMDSGKAETFEEFVDLADGRHFFISVKSPRFDDKGNVTGIVGISHDITNRKRREEQLRESQQKYKDLTETTGDFVWEVDSQGRYTYCSPQIEKLWGLKPSEMLGRTPFDLMPTEEGKKLLQAFLALGQSPKPFKGLDTASYDSKGCVVFLEINAVPFFNDGGKLLGFRGISRDVTERKKVEEALKESEQLYKTIFDNSDDGFVLVEPIYDENNNACDLRFLQLNLAYERQTGTKAVKVEGKRAKDIAPNLEQQWISLCGEVAKTGKLLRIEDFNQRTSKWYDAQYIPFAKGRVGILFRDVTEHKNLEKQLQDKERLAGIGATAGMVGHDIRNPLQAIMSDTYLLRSELTSMPECETKKDVAESLDGIENSVNYINKIVQDLQDYARPLTPIPKEADLEKIFEDVLVKKAIPERVKVNCNIKTEAKKLTIDPDLLKRVMANLVNNAVEAMPEGGRLTIHSYNDEEDTIVTVQDTGLGIPDEVKPKLFTPLFTTKSKGQGFGLAVVKRLTEALGGTVTFQSEQGKGTTFIVRLPTNSKKSKH